MLHLSYNLIPKFKSNLSYEAASLNAVEDELALGDSIDYLEDSGKEFTIVISHFMLDKDYHMSVNGCRVKSKQGRLFRIDFSLTKPIVIEKLGKDVSFDLTLNVYECTNAKSWTSKIYKRWNKINTAYMPISIKWE